MRSWWTNDPSDPQRPALTHPDVSALLHRIAPGAAVRDLGGNMSLNVHLPETDRVVRVHRPWNAMRRIRGEQRLRMALIDIGWSTPRPLQIGGQAVVRCGSRLAELETYLPGEQPPATTATYRWLFGEMGRLHRDLARLDPGLPRSLAANWAPPGSLRRWLAVTSPALDVVSDGAVAAARLRHVVRHVRRCWIPPRALPRQVIHGDFRPGNVVIDSSGRTVMYDWGFANVQTRVHDLAYAAAFMVLALGGPQADRSLLDELIACYEDTQGETLLPAERAMLPVDAAAVMVYALAHAGYMADPASALPLFLPFLNVAAWFLGEGAG